jgi:hypothetical protein
VLLDTAFRDVYHEPPVHEPQMPPEA